MKRGAWLLLCAWGPAAATEPAPPTWAHDIAPLVYRHCVECHRPGQVAPMSLLTYEDVRPWARAIKQRTAIRDRMGTMPPWYIEKNIGIQHYKNDPSLSAISYLTGRRISTLNGQMPPIDTHVVDTVDVDALNAWITAMP